MTTHLIHELEQLKKQIFSLVAMVENNLTLVVKAVQDRNKSMALQAVENDTEIDQAEVAVEEECLKLLALHQPVAIDLRFIVAMLKVNNDLERVGDLAVNIAERAVFLNGMPPAPIPFDFDKMAEKATRMLRQSLDALVNSDVPKAIQVCKADDEVDAINRAMYEQVKSAIREYPQHLDAFIHLLSVSRHLERVADHATNIAEDVIYLVRGRIVRHAPDVPVRKDDVGDQV
ncbi:MAG: phosphate signaling complex protein PhoU [Lentisphaerae bacterium]|nr:phosphate signaling complex protein PhoU [Lentisphaerota bacterium]